MDLTNKHPLTKSLIGDLIRIPNGKDVVTYKFNDWNIEIQSDRTNRWIDVNIIACNPTLKSTFDNYSVEKAEFMSFIAGYKNLKSNGKESSYSELILSDKYSKALLEQPNSEFSLSDKCLSYKGRVNRKFEINLVTLLIYFEKLTEKFDKINPRNAT